MTMTTFEKKPLLASWISRARAKSALGLGLIFILIVFPIYAIRSDITTVIGVAIAAYSPIYHWRLWNCAALNSYYDPIWFISLEAIVPFVFYGAVIGYFLNMPPRLNLKYATTVALAFICTLVVVFNVPWSDDPYPSQSCTR